MKVTSETKPVGWFKSDPRNARKHSATQIKNIAASISEFGYASVIVARPDGTIIGGHATLAALKQLEHDQIDCRIVHGLTDAQYAALGIALNKLPETSGWDEGVLAATMREIVEEGIAASTLGFGDKELASLLSDDDDEIVVEEIKVSEVQDEFWISVRGKLKDQAAMLFALDEAAKNLDSVTVELGTIAMED
jgi:ParB-like chromosome segregation protein Spo0J